MRRVTIETLSTHKRLVCGRCLFQILKIGVTREAQIVTIAAQQVSKVRGMGAVTCGAIAALEWGMANRLGHFRLHDVVAGAANLRNLCRQLRLSIGAKRMTAFTRFLSERRMFVGTRQLRFG